MSPALNKVRLACARGLEYLLVDEVKGLGIADVHEGLGVVECSASLTDAYRLCLWSRLASRVYWVLAEHEVADVEEMAQACESINWLEHHRGDDSTIAIDFHQRSSPVRHTAYAAQRIKDVVVDHLRAHRGSRPDVDRQDADLRIHGDLLGRKLIVSIDLSGQSLHRRGYRGATGAAPLKETLAAAMLIRGGWLDIYAEGGALQDPMCGSGTLIIEGAWMAADRAPSLARPRFGFHGWAQHDEAAWQSLSQEATDRAASGLAELRPCFAASDVDRRMTLTTQQNMSAAGVASVVTLARQPVERCRSIADHGLLVANPPYGERLEERAAADDIVGTLGETLQKHFVGWRASLLVRDKEQGRNLGLRADKLYRLFNGRLPCRLLVLDVTAAHVPKTQPNEVRTIDYDRLVPGAIDLRNRLQKNLARLKSWRRNNNIDCYRLYDADLPEFAAAIDVYGEHLHVQEYAPPSSIPADTAQQRLRALGMVLEDVFSVPRNFIHIKRRQRQRGSEQYRPTGKQSGAEFEVMEGGARLLVNLDDYLDCGLFLDSRGVRDFIAKQVNGKRFANLFCYTASATVRAALAGASSSVSVDTSNTYLDWARRSFELNGINGDQHRLVRIGALEWLQTDRGLYDCILLDPPTFSNTKTSRADFRVQDDHAALIKLASRRLVADGQLLFCTNFRKFELDHASLSGLTATEITSQTASPDFSRRTGHRCWQIKWADGAKVPVEENPWQAAAKTRRKS